MIRMGMCFEDPVDCQRMRTHEIDNALRTIGSGAARFRIVIEHRVDDRCMAALLVIKHITDCASHRVMKSLNQRVHESFSLNAIY